MLTNVPAIHALTAWRRDDAGAMFEQRIKELLQLSAGKTAEDDLGGNGRLWTPATIGYENPAYLAPILPQRLLAVGPAQAAPPLGVLRLPAKLTIHAPKTYLHCFTTNPCACAPSLPRGDWTTAFRLRPPPERRDHTAVHSRHTRDHCTMSPATSDRADVRPVVSSQLPVRDDTFASVLVACPTACPLDRTALLNHPIAGTGLTHP